MENLPRKADVYADTDLTLITIEKTRFLQFIRGSKLHENLTKLNQIRDTNTWNLLTQSKIFRGLSSHQITQLELILKLETIHASTLLIEENKKFFKGYIIRTGKVKVYQHGKFIKDLLPGEFAGEIYMLTKHLPSNYTFISEGVTEVYYISDEEAIEYIKKNPGVYMKLNSVYE
jgi:CRP-like cAMP-binding protein